MKPLAVFLSGIFLLVGPAWCQDRPEQGDVNGDGRRNVSDAVYLLRHIFADGPEPVDVPCAACDSCCPRISRLLKTGFDLNLDLLSGWVTPQQPADFCDEDGCNQAGVSRHYELATSGSEDPGDWITVDYATGLMWQTQSGDDWFDDVYQAIAYCDSLTLGPFDDWRLPSINELLTLVTIHTYRSNFLFCDRTLYGTEVILDMEFIGRHFWPWRAEMVKGWYWSSTITASWLVLGCGVEFSDYFYDSRGTDLSGYGRAVRQILPGDLDLLGLPEKPSGFYREAPRNGDVDGNGARNVNDVTYLLAHLFAGGPAPEPNDCPGCDSCCPDFPARPLQTGAEWGVDPGVPRSFEVLTFGSGDPKEWATVDHATGLMWQYACEGEARSYVEAVDLGRRFADRRLGGFGDWRIPNVFEILSLVNYSPISPHDYQEVFERPASFYNLLSSTLDVHYPQTASQCEDNFGVSAAYAMDFTFLSLGHHGLLYGTQSSVYLHMVRTIQPGDLER